MVFGACWLFVPTLPLAVQPYAISDITNMTARMMPVRFFITVLRFRLAGQVCMSMMLGLYM